VDDAAIFPPGDAPLHEATAAYGARTPEGGAEIVGTFVLRDTDLPLVRGVRMSLSVVVTGGAGQVTGPVQLARRLGLRVAALEIALRDLDDLAGNARRVVAALDEVAEDVSVYVELPQTETSTGWLAAADVVAEAELLLKFRTGGLEAAAYPTSDVVAGWIDAALDRETPFKCTAGLHRAIRHTGEDGFEHHGFWNVLAATEQAFDGAAPAEVAATLEQREATELPRDVGRARRWFHSFGSCSIAEPWADLNELGLV
jgi:hypothetical protein